MLTRRQFLRLGLAGSVLALCSRGGAGGAVAHAQVPVTTLDPASIPAHAAASSP